MMIDTSESIIIAENLSSGLLLLPNAMEMGISYRSILTCIESQMPHLSLVRYESCFIWQLK